MSSSELFDGIETEDNRGLVSLGCLELDPLNVRRTYRAIDQLAASILRHGLLQNLIIRPNPQKEGCFFVTAGNRRYMALKRLESGYRPAGLEDTEFNFDAIPCLVSDDMKRLYEQTVENVQREEVPLWDLGRRYIEMQELGASQVEIAARISKNSGHVSRAIRIARGVAPEVIEKLAKIPYSAISENVLLQIAAVPPINDFGDPDIDKQTKMVEYLIANGGFNKKKGRYNPTNTVKNRVKHLTRATVPREHYRTYTVIMAYLTGKTKSLEWDSSELF